MHGQSRLDGPVYLVATTRGIYYKNNSKTFFNARLLLLLVAFPGITYDYEKVRQCQRGTEEMAHRHGLRSIALHETFENQFCLGCFFILYRLDQGLCGFRREITMILINMYAHGESLRIAFRMELRSINIFSHSKHLYRAGGVGSQ
jgi:hypothetical protein